MIVVGALIAAAAVIVWISPRMLVRGRWQVRHPALALAAWHVAFLSGVVAAAAAIVVAVTTTLTTTTAAGVPATVVATVGGWVALAAVGGAAMLVASGRDAVTDATRHNLGALFSLPCSIRALDRRTDLRVCETAEVFACAIPGRRGTVAVSTGLIARTTPAQLRAIVAHERAHLALRHDLVLRLADLNVSCLPRSAAARRLRRSTGLLIELVADDHAAHRAGAVHLANALVATAAATGEVTMELRAERLSRHAWRPSWRLAPVPALYPALVADVARRS